MAPPLLRVLLIRAALLALPFVAWFVWRAWAQRTGRPMGSTPWPWLFAFGAVLVGISLMAPTILRDDRPGEVYMPGEATPSGRVTKGYFKERAAPQP